MKIKLKNTQAAADAEPSTNGASQPNGAPKLALKFKPVAAPASDPAEGPAGDAPKQKRKYTKKPKVDENGQPLPGTKPGPKPKKRPLEDVQEGALTKRKIKPTMKSLSSSYIQESDDDDSLPEPTLPPLSQQVARQNSIKLSLKKNPTGGPRGATAILKVKGHGKPPYRPAGVGYDSEAEEAELDPAIESQFVLRMAPGPDNDLLRKAIEEKTIGKSQGNGGLGVQFRFFDREGRKAMITIQGNHYAATMVELPCVVESLKSWNKKDWVKTADVCQMLLVLGRVENEEEAKKFTRSRDVEPDSHRYPHGLTPPMRWVRRRRFRPRKSYHDVERIENSTEELLNADEGAVESQYKLIDSDPGSSSDSSSSEDEDAEGEDEEMAEVDYAETPAADIADPDDIMALLHQEFEGDDQVEVEANGDVDMIDLFGDDAEIEVETPATASAHEVAMHALQQGNIIVETDTAASTPAAATSPDDDDEDDDDGDDDEEEEDPEEVERQREIEAKRAEIRELDELIAHNKVTQASATNVIYKKRLQATIESLTRDKEVKMSKIGMTEDD